MIRAALEHQRLIAATRPLLARPCIARQQRGHVTASAQKRQKVLGEGSKEDIGDLRTFVSQLNPRLLPSVEFGQIHCLIVVLEGQQQHPTRHRLELFCFLRFSLRPHDVAYWHLSDMPKQSSNVCCWGKSGPSSDTHRGPSLTQSGLWRAMRDPRNSRLARLKPSRIMVPGAVVLLHTRGRGSMRETQEACNRCCNAWTLFRALPFQSTSSLRTTSTRSFVLCFRVRPLVSTTASA